MDALNHFQISSLIKPLADCLDAVYKPVRKLKRLSSAKMLPSNGLCNQERSAVFDLCKTALKNQASLAPRRSQASLCDYGRVRRFFVWDRRWGPKIRSIVTTLWTTSSTASYCISPSHGLELRWSTSEKEAYAFIYTIEQIYWLLICSECFELYRDHHNLINLFNLLAVRPDLS